LNVWDIPTTQKQPEINPIMKRGKKTGSGSPIPENKIISPDLQNADIRELLEALSRSQAELEIKNRELQIEAALVKVRARTMAMQKSEELSETAFVLHQQFKELGEDPIQITIGIVNEAQGTIEFRITDWAGGGTQVNRAFTLSIEEPYLIKKVYAAWKEQKKSIIIDLSGEELQGWLDYRNSNSGVMVRSEDTSGRRVVSFAFFSKGHLSISSPEPLPAPTIRILERFAGVFDLTYTRFLDLQKAEGQAREAQIQLAMERVRARTMAMQNSNELPEAANLLFQQVKSLGMNSWSCGFNIWEQGDTVFTSYMGNPDGSILASHKIPLTEEATFIHFQESRDRGDKLWVEELGGEALKAHYRYFMTVPGIREAFEIADEAGFPLPAYQINHLANFSHGNLLFITFEPCPDYHDIFIRFAAVFEQTYTRFLDLQKAETQAREAQIQLAIERVRARTMAMHHSNELPDAALLLSNQVKELGVQLWGTSFQLWEKDRKEVTVWACVKEMMIPPFKVLTTEDPLYIDFSDAAAKKESLYVKELDGKALENHIQYMMSIRGFREGYLSVMDQGIIQPESNIFHAAYFSHGFILFITLTPYPEAHDIFQRFAKVFEQTYTRFLDLQKAEAQARESQIEAALERVRSRSMGMQKSEELKEVIQVVYDQFLHLNIKIEHTGFVMDYKTRDDYNIWIADPLGVPTQVTVPYFDSVYYNRFNEAKEKGENFFATNLTFEEKNKFYQKLFEYVPGLSEQAKEFYFSCPGLAASTVLLENVCLYIENFNGIPYTDAENNTLMRFGKVFQQTYTRFLDLQKAEAQVREAKIENALEKVRSRTMAMQRSGELGDVAEILFKQVLELGIHPWSTGFNIWQEGNDSYIDWVTNPTGGFMEPYTVDLTTHPVFREISAAKKRGEDFHVFDTSGEPLQETYALLISFAPKQFEGILASGIPFPTRQINHYVFGAQVGLMFITPEPCPDAWDIFRRFGKVFEQTYTRFLDLQKAEAQTREAQIEASLERVRSRSMGMQKSEELREVIQVIYEQMIGLNINIDGAGFDVEFRESNDWNIWHTDAYTPFPTKIHVPYFDHPFTNAIIEAKIKGVEFLTFNHTIENRNKIFDQVFKYAPASPEAKEAIYKTPGLAESHVYLKNVWLYISNYAGISYTDSENAILIRFGKVFEQTYTRFKDLKQAEILAKEAQKQAALDRVRGEIASMRSTDDLQRIIPLVWRELTSLGVPFIRCGVFIVDESIDKVQAFLSTPEGRSLGVLNLAFDANEVTQNVVTFWRKQEVYTGHWNQEQFIQWMQSMIARGQNINSTNYQGSASPPESLDLHFINFKQGMLYVGNTNPLSGMEIKLVKTLADAFSIAYSRYEDFKQLEEAKNHVESTLNKLKSTQSQLIQSEKMASLGELTAGIAHEIQNPLNFVNNFSEVNKELLLEMMEEIDKGNLNEVKALANNVMDNQEKINHHGKRADGIVKGMLQHSRSSTGVKEPTDVNSLADEYLRLAYHGLRAKDKSFNASMHTEFDETIGKINVIPQDMGRVILNLITNAFHSVAEKKKSADLEGFKNNQDDPYAPAISVKTKKAGNQVEIRVIDNGTGIPQKNLYKIFQPFFTTKSTGQGTGLGLSLSYDIVKAHGGELKVATKEGEGSEFIIQLPLN
jgi:signal transduction histidine kinase